MKTFITLFTVFSISMAGFSQDVEALFKRGESKYSSGNYEEAITAYTEAIKLDADFLNAYLRRAFCFSATKNYEKAINSYKEVEKIYPNMKSPKIMIPQIQELIKSKSI